MTEDDVLNFVAASFASMWAVELLLLLRRHGERAFTHDELIRELRSSHVAVAEALASLDSAGLVLEENGRYRFRAGSPPIESLVAELAKLHAVKPAAVMRAVLTSSNQKLRTFSDAFRLKD
jgi:predicted transcriptional regulator